MINNEHLCPECKKKTESFYANLPRWKVIWEERREVIIRAKSPEEAEKMVMEGRYNGNTVNAVTELPYALPVGD